ncbi:multidrug efflux MFS transporter [Hazenella sp. IB182357]|uniref:Multidrug efflux MFS transporter n=1 Tax=Polycladospora coralii TaxID=2771432 RepID=A0A926N5U5_9BACL|nr:MDR family MFS transporter [Polycladospora coralii]MBD1371276.1 multidrug efflux MFS transporter [Polycladospora coralii]
MNKEIEFLAEDPNVKVKSIMISLIIGAFFAILNETLLNVALTTLMEEFHVTATTVQWLATGFLLVMGIITPISALLLQSFTTRQMFMGTMTVFAIGTLICALAINFPLLFMGRILQAVGTGLLIPLIFNAILLIYPPERRGAVMGTIGLVITFAPAIGPPLSGIIVEYLGWRYLFIVVIPFILFSMAFAYKYLTNVGEMTKPQVDLRSIVYSTLGFGGIVLGFSLVGEGSKGFFDPKIILMILLGFILTTLFVTRQLKLAEPLLDMRVFRYPMFSLGVILFVTVVVVMFSTEIILPMYMQGPLALTAATTGLILLPGSLLNGVFSPVMGKLFDRYGPRKIIIPAAVVLAGDVLIMSQIKIDTPIWMIIVTFTVLMISISAIMMPAQTNGLNELPKNLYPHGSAVMNTLIPVMGAVGISVFMSLLAQKQQSFIEMSHDPTAQTTQQAAFVSGFEFVFFVSFGIVFIGLIASLFVKRPTPAESIEETS